MEDQEVKNEYDARMGQVYPGVIEDATHVNRKIKRLYRKNGQFADFWVESFNTWMNSSFIANDLDNKEIFTLI